MTNIATTTPIIVVMHVPTIPPTNKGRWFDEDLQDLKKNVKNIHSNVNVSCKLQHYFFLLFFLIEFFTNTTYTCTYLVH